MRGILHCTLREGECWGETTCYGSIYLCQQAGTADPSREREERIQASLKEREREVQMSRSAQEKEWGRERDQLRRSEALQQFKAMLADTVRHTHTMHCIMCTIAGSEKIYVWVYILASKDIY